MSYAISIKGNWAGSAAIVAGLARLSTAAGDVDRRQEETDTLDLDDVRNTLDGDEDGFRRLMARHQSRISAMMWRFSREHGVHEELVQDVFVEAFSSLHTFRAKAPFAHWLARIATRVGYRYWKSVERARDMSLVPMDECRDLEAVDELEPSEAGDLLYRLLEQLPPRDRLVMVLRYVEDYSVEQTARLTGWGESMVKVQAWRARNKLKRLFEKAQEAG
jgi:RNA polymerase sigma-70 factor (ECF subfamily)